MRQSLLKPVLLATLVLPFLGISDFRLDAG